MPTLTDARFDALRVLVPLAPPTTNDMLFAWLATEGGVGDTLGDRWNTMLLSKVANAIVPGIVVASGTHDGAANSAFLQDTNVGATGKPWPIPDGFKGLTVFNTTDGSQATVTSNDDTQVFGQLGGGTDDDWDAGDAYEIRNEGGPVAGRGRNDMWKAVLAANGFAQPHINDAQLAYWVAGGPALT